jgi:F0F1-type ATP synthase membrane subunit b/b'
MKVMNPENLSIDINQLITITIISQIIAIIIFMVLLWFFYKLIYGILLKKLNRNYKELSKLESAN